MLEKLYVKYMPLYFFGLVYMMLFGCGRTAGEIGNLQLKPFHMILNFTSFKVPFEDFFLNIVCNVVVFMPFGFLGLIHKNCKNIGILLPLFICGIISIELTQHFTGRGVADIDDVFLNTIGMLSGYFLFSKLAISEEEEIHDLEWQTES